MVGAVLLCPGQGAQRVGMGKDLAQRFPESAQVFERADAALGAPLSGLMWEGPEEELTLTHNAQPAILVHSLAAHAAIAGGVKPVAAAGHSLGEYAAYASLGALKLEDAVRLVRRRGELMREAGERRPGTMAAVLGLDTAAVERVCGEASRDGSVVVAANLNAPDQTVISGDPDAVERAQGLLKEAGAKRVLPLKVSGAFHSPLMTSARAGLEAALAEAVMTDPPVPVVANASAEPVRDAVTAQRLLAEQLTAPVRWVECMRALKGLAGGARFVEIGPGNVLAGLLKRIVPDAVCISIGTVADVEKFGGADK